jgi:hypothetical protein
VESAQPGAEEPASIATEAAGIRNGQSGNGQRGRGAVNKEFALSELAEIKAQVELPSARTSAEIQDLARSNLEKLKSFYDPSDPSQKMIRERLDGGNIKGAFFVWTTGLAPIQWSDLPPAAQKDSKPDTAYPSDAGLAANVAASTSQTDPGSALTVGTAPPVMSAAAPLADNQPPISCGVLELVKFTLELE